MTDCWKVMYLRAFLKLTLVVCFMFIILTTAMGQESNYVQIRGYSETLIQSGDEFMFIPVNITTVDVSKLSSKGDRSYNTDKVCSEDGLTFNGVVYPFEKSSNLLYAFCDGDSYLLYYRERYFHNFTLRYKIDHTTGLVWDAISKEYIYA